MLLGALVQMRCLHRARADASYARLSCSRQRQSLQGMHSCDGFGPNSTGPSAAGETRTAPCPRQVPDDPSGPGRVHPASCMTSLRNVTGRICGAKSHCKCARRAFVRARQVRDGLRAAFATSLSDPWRAAGKAVRPAGLLLFPRGWSWYLSTPQACRRILPRDPGPSRPYYCMLSNLAT